MTASETIAVAELEILCDAALARAGLAPEARAAFEEATGRFQSFTRATPPADPDHPVLLPGEREQAARQRALREGVAVPARVLAGLRRLAA